MISRQYQKHNDNIRIISKKSRDYQDNIKIISKERDCDAVLGFCDRTASEKTASESLSPLYHAPGRTSEAIHDVMGAPRPEASQHRPQDCGKRGEISHGNPQKLKTIHVFANAIQRCSSVKIQYFFVQRIHLFRKDEIALFDDARGRLNKPE